METKGMRYGEKSRVIPLFHYRQRQAMINLTETLQTPPERRLLLYLRNKGCSVSLQEICRACHTTEQNARSILAILANKGLMRRVQGERFVSP